MPPITDEYMREMMQTTKSYTLVLLKAGPQKASDAAAGIIWEHGRRNFSLRAEGVLAIVCPVLDESEWSGIGIFDAPPDEVRRIMDEDPGVKAGVFEYEVHPVRSCPGDALPG
jgi:hypothetical protein